MALHGYDTCVRLPVFSTRGFQILGGRGSHTLKFFLLHQRELASNVRTRPNLLKVEIGSAYCNKCTIRRRLPPIRERIGWSYTGVNILRLRARFDSDQETQLSDIKSKERTNVSMDHKTATLSSPSPNPSPSRKQAWNGRTAFDKSNRIYLNPTRPRIKKTNPHEERASIISIWIKEWPMLEGNQANLVLGGKSHWLLPQMAYRIKARICCTVLSPYNWLYTYQIPCASLFPTQPLQDFTCGPPTSVRIISNIFWRYSVLTSFYYWAKEREGGYLEGEQ